MEEIIYAVASFGVAFLALIAAYGAWYAMHRGLTYSAMMAAVWALVFMGIARLWHSVREVTELGEWAEYTEYAIYLIAYTLFIGLVLRAIKTPTPEDVRCRD